MKLIILLLTVWIFTKTISYGVYEYQDNRNKVGGVIIFVLSTISLLLPNVIIFMNY